MNSSKNTSTGVMPADMTPVQLPDMKLSGRHIWIVFVASLGQMIGTALATLVGIVIPMIQILSHPELPSWLQGLLGCMDLIGIAIGSVILGNISDKKGYLGLFRICPLLMVGGTLMSIFFPNVWVLLISLFIIGFAIGGEYSLDSNYISELMPVKWRSFMVGAAKAASALGNILVAGICYLLIVRWNTAEAWPKLLWIIAIMAGVMFILRIDFAGSPRWLIEHGKKEEAKKALKRFFPNKNVVLSQEVIEQAEKKNSVINQKNNAPKQNLFSFIRQNGKKVVLSGIPWACEGLGVYGIGVFLPMLVMALGLEHYTPDMSRILHVASSVEITFWISCLILPGFVIGLAIINKIDNIKILYWGFFICAISLVVLLYGYEYRWAKWISLTSFMIFELFLNIGPHLITYVLPPKIYPVAERGIGSGLAACIGKIGAVLAVFFIPMLLSSGGATLVLWVSAGVMFIGGLTTLIVGPKVLPSEKA